MTEHREGGRKDKRERKVILAERNTKHSKRIKGKTKRKAETKQFLFVPFSNSGPKDTSLNTSSTQDLQH